MIIQRFFQATFVFVLLLTLAACDGKEKTSPENPPGHPPSHSHGSDSSQ